MSGAEEGNAAAAEDAKSCAECGTISPDLKRCMACKSVHYCSTACQRSNRKAHKKECKVRAFELDVEHAKSKLSECPLCMYILPVKKHGSSYMACCGNRICNACVIEDFIARGDQVCAFCRAPPPCNNKDSTGQILARIEKGDTAAMVNMACDYLYGDAEFDVDEDRKKGAALLLRAVDLGCANACALLGELHLDGVYVQQDYDKSEQLLTQSANAGSAGGAFGLSQFYVTMGRNMSASAYHLRLSAAMGYEPAMQKLTEMYTKTDPLHKFLKKEEFEASLRSFQAAQDAMKSEARDKWGDEGLTTLSKAGHSWHTLKLYKEGVISSLPATKK